ncbi:unnamed protein product [Rotaria magnacalcarata]|uniref:Uncharacterized protein n=1 Tax=Rotaria magnacalcarata TaxID=392030 RepID=A0A820FA15_9BILA|nr:unnamed protein product [Rotaria magnacalcarata]CAF3862423.1 unnamed protein product [Rotaria magnacalcarata]CAF4007376.1 unnamed protein product [Rotaria magnacalcarata]CAF4257706.1 unnamed protein product [Rotaria magnacalcarata]CAF4635952.1 unnamed protein product [Rotaria magnacalcarata]
MSIRYRFKRNKFDSLLNDPIPVHPDAIYRSHNRPKPENVPLLVSRVIKNNVIVSAPFIANDSDFSFWSIMGPLFVLFIILGLGVLAYRMKKKRDSEKRFNSEDNETTQKNDDRKTNEDKIENLRTHDSKNKSTVQNVTLTSTTVNIVPHERIKFTRTSSDTEEYETISMINSDSALNRIDCLEPHGIDKSPLISMFPSGTKRNEKQKLKTRHDQIKTRNITLNSHIENQQSDINKDKQKQLTTNINSKYDSSFESSEIISSSSLASGQPTKAQNSRIVLSNEESNRNILQSSGQYSTINKNNLDIFDNRLQSNNEPLNHQKIQKLDDNKSNATTTTSLTQLNLISRNKTITLMPNVPQCKSNKLSDDNDDYDEIYSFPENNSKNQ